MQAPRAKLPLVTPVNRSHEDVGQPVFRLPVNPE